MPNVSLLQKKHTLCFRNSLKFRLSSVWTQEVVMDRQKLSSFSLKCAISQLEKNSP